MKPQSRLDGVEERLRSLVEAEPVTRGMTIRVERGHVYLGRQEPPGPFSDETPDDRLRLTPASGLRFRMSVKRHTGAWDATPFVGTLEELLQVVRADLQHLVADLYSPPG
jgi:hypothetical protein